MKKSKFGYALLLSSSVALFVTAGCVKNKCCAQGDNEASGVECDISDPAAEILIREALQREEGANLSFVPKEDRKFKYQAFDFNHDGEDEYVVALYTRYYSGTGGSTAYIFDAQGTVVSRFTVVHFPIYVAASRSEGWQDLIIYSGGENRFVKRTGGAYPSNPSVEMVYNEEPSDSAPALLDIYENERYPTFTF
ncbi:MAG: hypothetical protein JXR40_02175 [Pontiellaceae bacterium]|nr:hypothetical protein [Pontiellaceae bacterium]